MIWPSWGCRPFQTHLRTQPKFIALRRKWPTSRGFKAKLTDHHHLLQRLSREVLESVSDDEPGSMLQLLDRLRLSVDRFFGDNDTAADGASRDSIQSLLTLIDDHLRDPELSSDVRAVFAAVRERVPSGERPHPEDPGLKGLPS